MKKQMAFVTFILVIISYLGRSYTLHETEKDEAKGDLGRETKFHLRGPRAVVEHKFYPNRSN